MTKYEKVKKLIEQGLSVKEATDKVKLPISSYYGYRVKESKGKVIKTRKPSVKNIEIPQAQSERVICLIGSREDVLSVIRGMQ